MPYCFFSIKNAIYITICFSIKKLVWILMDSNFSNFFFQIDYLPSIVETHLKVFVLKRDASVFKDEW